MLRSTSSRVSPTSCAHSPQQHSSIGYGRSSRIPVLGRARHQSRAATAAVHGTIGCKLSSRVCQPRSCSLICTLSVRLLKNIVVCRLLLFVVVRGTLGWLLVIVIGCSRVISREYDYSRLLDIVIYRWRSFVHPSHSSQPLLSLSRLYLPQCACNTRACKLAVLYY